MKSVCYKGSGLAVLAHLLVTQQFVREEDGPLGLVQLLEGYIADGWVG